ncbi:MAG: DUF2845 domain-containing protein, partial [Desulfococcaceae bacterium]
PFLGDSERIPVIRIRSFWFSAFSSRWRLAALVVLLHLIHAPSALALRCDGAIIDEGTSKPEVFHRCGEPYWQERRVVETLERKGREVWNVRSDVIEEWLYNFGPTRLLRILTFENGTLKKVRTAGHGFVASSRPDNRLNPAVIQIGDTKAEVFSEWGEPDEADDFHEERIARRTPDRVYRINVQISEWIYNPGRNAFIRILRFENGRLREIVTGDRGF